MAILNFGSLNIDKVYKVPHFVRPGETISSESYKCFPGGKGLNQSIAVARAGETVYHAGTIGRDGLFLKELLKENGVDTRYVRECGQVTGHALIQVSEEGDNCIILHGGSNYENDTGYIDQVLQGFGREDILLLQNEISHLAYLLKRGAEKGMRIMLNPSPMNEELKHLDLSGVTWLMLNETEGKELTGEVAPDRILKVLSAKYDRIRIILTLGEEGSVYRGDGVTLYQPCFHTVTVDTTAAGDTFTGYFIAAAVEGRSAAQALRTASAAAARAVAREGAAVSIPDRYEAEQLLEAAEGEEYAQTGVGDRVF